jgi:hypothetical protein
MDLSDGASEDGDYAQCAFSFQRAPFYFETPKRQGKRLEARTRETKRSSVRAPYDWTAPRLTLQFAQDKFLEKAVEVDLEQTQVPARSDR